MTVNTMNLAVMLQLAANENMRAQIGDLKNAFGVHWRGKKDHFTSGSRVKALMDFTQSR